MNECRAKHEPEKNLVEVMSPDKKFRVLEHSLDLWTLSLLDSRSNQLSYTSFPYQPNLYNL